MNSSSTSQPNTPNDPTVAEESLASEAAGTFAAPAQPPSKRRSLLLDYPATYLLLAINVVVYAIMFRYGPLPALLHDHAWTSIVMAPFDVEVLARFGGTASDLVLHNHQWWRLVSGCFVHISLLHIALNMWCLWNLGIFGEPLLGRRGLVAVYLLTGTAGMMLSTTFAMFSGQPGLVAGASGSIFGLAGILIVLLSNRKLRIPWNDLKALRRQVIFFAVANLAIGMAPGLILRAPASQLAALHLDPAVLPRIDNTAHLGGCIAGLVLGLPLFSQMTAGRALYRRRQQITYSLAAGLLCLLAFVMSRIAAEIPPN